MNSLLSEPAFLLPNQVQAEDAIPRETGTQDCVGYQRKVTSGLNTTLRRVLAQRYANTRRNPTFLPQLKGTFYPITTRL